MKSIGKNRMKNREEIDEKRERIKMKNREEIT